ncbi:MAG TPA: hypothetical protein VFC73_07815 [Syntrophomonadaceae bacterium]|nr:hypothetical protein [Syntrophomonadaceae bacterium]
MPIDILGKAWNWGLVGKYDSGISFKVKKLVGICKVGVEVRGEERESFMKVVL